MATTKKYTESIGRRKTATARVRLTEAKQLSIVVNDKESSIYFPTTELQKIIHDSFSRTKIDDGYSITVLVSGGGIHSQAEAVRHGIARSLVKIGGDENKILLKVEGYLKRDPRSKERRKAGKAGKARKGKQWSKR
ncbi:MAG: small subunit ribosomal protein S9 [Candidatus Paceibacteria bacterium]|jgi:small subunit ribosomal protein S9